MAQKRMFDRSIVSSDEFTEMSSDAQNLYFHLGVQADDEGFVTPKGIMRMISASPDSLKVLVIKKFVIPFESGVVVITAWNQNNWLDSRRIQPTKHRNERLLLTLTEDNSYVLSDGLALAKHPLRESRVEEYRIEENRIEESRYGILNNVKLAKGDYTKLCGKYGSSATNSLIEQLSTYVGSTGKKYKSHYCTLLNWAGRKNLDVLSAPGPIVAEVILTEEQEQKNRELRGKITTMLRTRKMV